MQWVEDSRLAIITRPTTTAKRPVDLSAGKGLEFPEPATAAGCCPRFRPVTNGSFGALSAGRCGCETRVTDQPPSRTITQRATDFGH